MGLCLIDRMNLLAKQAQRRDRDPWLRKLRDVKGKKGDDGIERIASVDLYALLGADTGTRNKEQRVAQKLAKVMAELGWTPIRLWGLASKGDRSRLRGYGREWQLGAWKNLEEHRRRSRVTYGVDGVVSRPRALADKPDSGV